MAPAKLSKIILRRGLYWPGVIYACFSDSAFSSPAKIEGWQPVMTAMVAPGKTAAITFTCSLDDQSRVVVAPLSEAATLALKVGEYQADLCFIDTEGHAVGPYGRAQVIVENVNTLPEVA